ncbi:hypothetical protein MtrunA17_Chr1g0157711 [Medicago truncatula]|uniref:F-box SKIP23-like protein n=1 Tax=Medicago truncatula TaxID=3880 RepID=A0A072VE49_MEDTR|nr:F-box protein SKIP23 [Medicago truncatula]KEH40294.1 F-box SKIP23-like protein [Medicago truncatula]RHN77711.1 hypothetical protein MtrunA17_Chr1g0157711 [Medicago truncatula]
MEEEADWSELPQELLNLISQQFDNEIDLIRFRSICTNWHSSSIPNHHRNILTIKFPLYIDSITNKTPFSDLSKHGFFIIKSPPQSLIHPWLTKITQNSTGKIKHYLPFRRHSSPSPSPVFDFNNFSLIHLVTNFIYSRHNTEYALYGCVKPAKVVAATSYGNKPIIVASFNCKGEEQLVVFKCGDENWKFIPEMSVYFGDIRAFKGQCYVVDKTGQTVTVGPDDSTVQLVAESLLAGGDIKFLVESKGDLLLADVYNRDIDDYDYDRARIGRIDMFKLNEKEKKWVKLANLGDRVLFLGSLCSFSASALDLCVPKGNCVIIMDDIFTCDPSMGYFLDLDDGRPLPLFDYPEYSKLFWPPPKWMV